MGLVNAASPPAAPGVFSLDRLRLGGAGGPENYVYASGDVIYPDGGVDAGTYYRFLVSDSAGAIRNGSFSCTPASAFSTTDNRYVVAPADPVSTGTAWRYTLQQFNNAGCTGSPAKTVSKSFYVARAAVFADSGLKTANSRFGPGQTAYVAISGVKPSRYDWSASWIAPSGSTVCANTAGSDRADSSGIGRLPKGASANLQYKPSSGTGGSAWNREVNYETRPCPAFGPANEGSWSLRVQLDPTDFVVLPVFTVDATPPPPPTIDAAPGNPSTSRSATFRFTSSESDAAFTCRLDGAAFASCSSPTSYTGLTDGSHTFDVRARDTTGNDSAIASYTWVVDATAPAVTLTAPANGSTTNDATPTFAGQAGTSQGDSTSVIVNVYAGASASGTPQQTLTAVVTGGSYSVDASSPLADGTYTAQAEQVDLAGNVGRSAAAMFAINTGAGDTTPPTVTLTAPADGSTTNDSTPSFAGAAGTDTGDATSVTVKVYAGTSASGTPVQTRAANVTGGSYSVDASPALADGTFTAQAEQSDLAGNVGLSATRTFTVDATAPAVTLTQPANGSTVTTSTPTLSGAAGTAAGDAAAVTIRIYAGTAPSGTPVQQLSTTRSGGTWSATPAALADGTYTARAEQADSAGNLGLSAASTFTVAVTAPPPSGDYPGVVLTDAPRAYWRLGEAAGTTAADESPNRIAGIYVNGVTLGRAGAVSGDANSSIALDGVNDTVRVPNAAVLNSSSAMSLEVWLNVAALPASSATLARKEGQYLLRLYYDGSIVFRLWKGGAINELATSGGAVTANTWRHVVATWDGATMRLYVNGTLRTSRTLAAPVDVNTNDLYLGSSYNSYDYYAGRLDEAAVYTAALPASRVAAHYTAANPEATGGPAVSLLAPANGSTTDATPNFGGSGSLAVGDASTVTVKVYSGSGTSGPLVRNLTAPLSSSGTFSVVAAALTSGAYTAVAEQANSAGAIGRSTPTVFTLDAAADPVVLAAGDIAGCDTFGDEATAAILDRLPGTVVPNGDLVYEDGTAQEFADCYDPTWGRHKARTRPVVDGHEYRTPGAAPYYAYWGAVAGDPAKGYYSYDIGGWHVIALNAECAAVGGCGTGSPQEVWLRSDLAAHPTLCTLTFLHAPRFSSGNIHGSNPDMQPFWQALYDAGAELVVSGDDHIYERFAPQTPTGAADAVRGIREIIAGTGGRSHYGIGTIKPNSEVRNTDTFGILKLTLHSGGYDWNFVPEAGKTFTDAGSGTCH